MNAGLGLYDRLYSSEKEYWVWESDGSELKCRDGWTKFFPGLSCSESIRLNNPINEFKSCFKVGFYEDSWGPVGAPKSIDTSWTNDDCYTTTFAMCQKKVANDDWKWINCYGPDSNWIQKYLVAEPPEAEESIYHSPLVDYLAQVI